MIDLLTLLWHFLRAQPPVQYVQLVSWHLLLLLLLLGVLSAFGLHFLIGYLLRFYRRKERHARWVAWPTLPVLLVSVLALLGTYLLGVHASALVRTNLTTTMTEQLGRALLEPAFQTPVLAAHAADAVPKAAIKAALRSASELDYRTRLQERITDPVALAPAADGTGGARGPDLLVQMGLRWVTEPHSGWVAPTAPRDSAPDRLPGASDAAFFLPDFLIGLVEELPEDTVLPRLDWEHVAGTRFVEGVLRPLVEEYLSYLALALALLVLLVDAVYFLLVRRLKRIGQPRAAKPAAKPIAKAAAKPAASPSKSPAATAPATAAAPAPAATTAAAPAPAAATAESPAANLPVPAPPAGSSAPALAAGGESPAPDTTTDKPAEEVATRPRPWHSWLTKA